MTPCRQVKGKCWPNALERCSIACHDLICCKWILNQQENLESNCVPFQYKMYPIYNRIVSEKTTNLSYILPLFSSLEGEYSPEKCSLRSPKGRVHRIIIK